MLRMLSSNVALIDGSSTKPGSSYYALIKAARETEPGLQTYYTNRAGSVPVLGVRLRMYCANCAGSVPVLGVRAASNILYKPHGFGAYRWALCPPPAVAA